MALGNRQRTKRRCDLVFAVNFIIRHEEELVIALANVRLASRHVARHFVFSNKANSRHLVVLQRRAVVDLAGRTRGQRHVLIIVEVKNVSIFIRRNGEGVRRCTLEGVAVYILLYFFRVNYGIEIRCIMERLSNRVFCIASPIVIHRVAQVFLLLEYSVIYSIRVQT